MRYKKTPEEFSSGVFLGLETSKSLLLVEKSANLPLCDLIDVDSVVIGSLGGLLVQLIRAFALDLETTKLLLTEVSDTRRCGWDTSQARAGKPITSCGEKAQPNPLGVVCQIVILDVLNCLNYCAHFGLPFLT